VAVAAGLFTFMHGQSGWCINSPDADRWMCDRMSHAGALFDKHYIRWSLAAGDLMGALRRGEHIPWEKDSDLCVHADDAEFAQHILANPKSQTTRSTKRTQARPGSLISAQVHPYLGVTGEIKVDLFVCGVEKEYTQNTPDFKDPYFGASWRTPRDSRRIEYCGFNASVCPECEQALVGWYGDSWREEHIQPYPYGWSIPNSTWHAGARKFGYSFHYGSLHNINRDFGCSILMDGWLRFPSSDFEWAVYHLLTLGFFCTAVCVLILINQGTCSNETEQADQDEHVPFIREIPLIPF
jgi:hypothetical protein